MYDIVVLDTGANLHNDEKIEGFSINKNRATPIIYNDTIDDNGHGTVIYHAIRKCSPSSVILIAKMFNDSSEVSESDLIYALTYIKDNIPCRIINLSLGLKNCHDISGFKQLCAEIVDSGIIIVAAFDNDKCHSYPACFDKVIGVDSNDELRSIYDFEYVESSPVNIRAKGGIQKIKFDNGRATMVSGSSIACAYITAFIANVFKDAIIAHDKVLEYMEKHAVKKYHSRISDKSNMNKSKMFEIKNAALFPINKEMHSLIRFNDLLQFNVQHYYDVRYSGRVGMKIKNIYSEVDNEIIIEDIENAELNDIDTIIIGHMDELNMLCQYDLRDKIIKRAINKKVNIYSFDDLSNYTNIIAENQLKFFYPCITIHDIPQNTFGKLYKISKPVVSIHGTSSRQGKFSLQLTLKRIFKENDYRIGCIGTEPNSFLFDMEIMYPMGYNSTVYVDSWQSITYLNNQIHQLCEKDVEIIIAASQSGSVPQNYNNLSCIPIIQNTFLMGIQPDAIILCINAYDKMSYIKNSIQLLQGISDSKVIALVMFPLTISTGMTRNRPVSKEYFHEWETIIQTELNIPLYLLGDKEHMLRLYQIIIDYF